MGGLVGWCGLCGVIRYINCCIFYNRNVDISNCFHRLLILLNVTCWCPV